MRAYRIEKGSPTDITTGQDGNLWFTDRDGSIGRITTGGKITTFPLPSGSSPHRITVGPDGTLWFTEGSNNKVGRLSR